MNLIAAYVEMLLRKHDCVVIPGFGALLCNYVPACFADEKGFVINPPSRSLAFNAMLSDSDGLIASALSRKEGIAYEAAVRRIGDEVESLRRQLASFGELQFGNLGMFLAGDEGRIGFVPDHVPSVNGAFYGLSPVEVRPLDYRVGINDSASEIVTAVEERITHGSAWRAYGTGIVASLAVVVTLALFLLPSIKIDRSLRTASIAPVPTVVPSIEVDPYNADVLMQPDWAHIGRLASVVVTVNNAPSEATVERMAKPSPVTTRFNESDPYCVIVASFPTKEQADRYIASNSAKQLGILAKDGRFRIYAATAESYAEADARKTESGQEDAWVCRR